MFPLYMYVEFFLLLFHSLVQKNQQQIHRTCIGVSVAGARQLISVLALFLKIYFGKTSMKIKETTVNVEV